MCDLKYQIVKNLDMKLKNANPMVVMLQYTIYTQCFFFLSKTLKIELHKRTSKFILE